MCVRVHMHTFETLQPCVRARVPAEPIATVSLGSMRIYCSMANGCCVSHIVIYAWGIKHSHGFCLRELIPQSKRKVRPIGSYNTECNSFEVTSGLGGMGLDQGSRETLGFKLTCTHLIFLF